MSTIFADNFKNTSGGDPVNINEVKTDKITGKTTAGSITVQGEGTATTNLQQGLAKAWANAPGNATSINDSFNTTSLTDTNTGNAQFNLTNNMSAINYSFTVGHQYTTTSGTGAFFSNPISDSSSAYQTQHYQNGSIADPQKYSGLAVHGDLA